MLDTDLSATLQADRLFRMNGPKPYALHLELESGSRLGIPEELLRYNVSARAVHGLPVHSVLVLLRPKARAGDQTGQLEIQGIDGRAYISFRYTVVRLWEESLDSLLEMGPGLAPLAILTDEAADDLDRAFSRLQSRLRKADVTRKTEKFLHGASFFLGGLRYNQERIREIYGRLSMTLEDSTTYQWVLKQGEARGEAKGEARGEAKGAVQHAKGVILKIGTKRFGPASKKAKTTLRAIADLERLDRLVDRCLDATGWDELLGTE